MKFTEKDISVAIAVSTFQSENSSIFIYLEYERARKSALSTFTSSMRFRLVVTSKIKISEMKKMMSIYHLHHQTHYVAIRKRIKKKTRIQMKNPRGSLWKMPMRHGSWNC